jgi:hypothetical protein
MSFRITGLAPEPFQPLFALPEPDLLALGAQRCIADAPRGYPCRISLCDAAPGTELLLVNFEHQPAPTPYRARHAIFVGRAAGSRFDRIDELPDMFHGRLLALRAFDRDHLMTEAAVVAGSDAAETIETLLADPSTAYLHAHFAARGCYAARIDRA